MQTKTIYIADNDNDFINVMKYMFDQELIYSVKYFSDGGELLDNLKRNECDIVILGNFLAELGNEKSKPMDCFEVCQKIRMFSSVPIIMLTSRTSESDYIKGISLGADDYLPRDINHIIILLKIKALLRRVDFYDKQKNTTKFGDLYIDSTNTCMCRNIKINFSAIEIAVILMLISSKNHIASREDLLNKIWSSDITDDRAIDNAVRRIRKKLLNAESSVIINSIRSYGYEIKDIE